MMIYETKTRLSTYKIGGANDDAKSLDIKGSFLGFIIVSICIFAALYIELKSIILNALTFEEPYVISDSKHLS